MCDVRWYLADPGRGKREFDVAHIPGALFVDLETVLTGPTGPGRNPLPRPSSFTHALGELGIDAETEVVAYDDSGGAIAARLWWMLSSIGHKRIAVLDGGFTAWLQSGYGTTDRTAPVTAVEYPVHHRWNGVVDRYQVAAADAKIVDARAIERFRGDVEPIDPRPGHIPGAVSLPHLENLSPDGRHLTPEQLSSRYAGLGQSPILYCGSGITACHNLLAMAVAGVDEGRLYEGSWSDWSSQPDLSVATGP